MNPTSKVVFPAPPATLNRLSSQQRALLMRKAKKIEQVLGVPPQLVDVCHKETGLDPILETYDIPTLHCAVNFRSSCHSLYSSSTAPDGLSGDVAHFSPCKRRQSLSVQRHDNNSPIKGRTNPVMRLVLRSLRFNQTTPPTPTHPVKQNTVEDTLDQFAQQSDACEGAHSSISNVALTPSPQTPTFTIPTKNSLRKAKMDRLRKRLGSGVPVELVFRENENGTQRPSCDCSIRQASNGIHEAATARATTLTSCECDNRPLPALPKKTLRRSTTTKLKAKRPRSAKGCTIHVPPPGITDFRPAKGPLPFIQECSDEHLSRHKKVVIKLPRAKQPVLHDRPITGESPLYYLGSHRDSSFENWTYDSGANTATKRSPSYRKPPPIVENLA